MKCEKFELKLEQTLKTMKGLDEDMFNLKEILINKEKDIKQFTEIEKKFDNERKEFLQDSKEKDKKILEQDFKIESLMKNTEMLIIKLRTLKEKINFQEKEINQLNTDKNSLEIRAAAGFDDLTPRPCYSRLQAEFPKEFEELEGNSTREKFEKLLINIDHEKINQIVRLNSSK